MTSEFLTKFLLWALGLNYAILVLWALLLFKQGDWLYQCHSRWFLMPRARFEALHYFLMGLYKILTIIFVLVPLLALYLVSA